MIGKMAEEERVKERRKDNINEALRAREFSEEETLKRGFDLIHFAVKMNRRATVEED